MGAFRTVVLVIYQAAQGGTGPEEAKISAGDELHRAVLGIATEIHQDGIGMEADEIREDVLLALEFAKNRNVKAVVLESLKAYMHLHDALRVRHL